MSEYPSQQSTEVPIKRIPGIDTLIPGVKIPYASVHVQTLKNVDGVKRKLAYVNVPLEGELLRRAMMRFAPVVDDIDGILQDEKDILAGRPLVQGGVMLDDAHRQAKGWGPFYAAYVDSGVCHRQMEALNMSDDFFNDALHAVAIRSSHLGPKTTIDLIQHPNRAGQLLIDIDKMEAYGGSSHRQLTMSVDIHGLKSVVTLENQTTAEKAEIAVASTTRRGQKYLSRSDEIKLVRGPSSGKGRMPAVVWEESRDGAIRVLDYKDWQLPDSVSFQSQLDPTLGLAMLNCASPKPKLFGREMGFGNGTAFRQEMGPLQVQVLLLMAQHIIASQTRFFKMLSH